MGYIDKMISKQSFLVILLCLVFMACAHEKPKSTQESLKQMIFEMGQDYQMHTLDHARERDQNPGQNLKTPMNFDEYQKERKKVIEGK